MTPKLQLSLAGAITVSSLVGCGGDAHPPPPSRCFSEQSVITCTASATGVCLEYDMTGACIGGREDQPDHVPAEVVALGHPPCGAYARFGVTRPDGGPPTPEEGQAECERIDCGDCEAPPVDGGVAPCESCAATFVAWGMECPPEDRTLSACPEERRGGTSTGSGDGGVDGSETPEPGSFRILSFPWAGPGGGIGDPVAETELPDALAPTGGITVVRMEVLPELGAHEPRLFVVTSGVAGGTPPLVAAFTFEPNADGTGAEGVLDYGLDTDGDGDPDSPFPLPVPAARGGTAAVTSVDFFTALSSDDPWALVGTTSGVFLFDMTEDGPIAIVDPLSADPTMTGTGAAVVANISTFYGLDPVFHDPLAGQTWTAFTTSMTATSTLTVTQNLGGPSPQGTLTSASTDGVSRSMSVAGTPDFPPGIWVGEVPAEIESFQSGSFSPATLARRESVSVEGPLTVSALAGPVATSASDQLVAALDSTSGAPTVSLQAFTGGTSTTSRR